MRRHPHPLTARVRRRPTDNCGVGSPLPRQWRLLEELSSNPKGLTVNELVRAMGVSDKTIRRDLVQFSQLGFDLTEIVEKFGRKRWRIRHPFERLETKWQQYRMVGESLAVLIEQAQAIGDRRLVDALKAIRRKVGRKCG